MGLSGLGVWGLGWFQGVRLYGFRGFRVEGPSGYVILLLVLGFFIKCVLDRLSLGFLKGGGLVGFRAPVFDPLRLGGGSGDLVSRVISTLIGVISTYSYIVTLFLTSVTKSPMIL